MHVKGQGRQGREQPELTASVGDVGAEGPSETPAAPDPKATRGQSQPGSCPNSGHTLALGALLRLQQVQTPRASQAPPRRRGKFTVGDTEGLRAGKVSHSPLEPGHLHLPSVHGLDEDTGDSDG